MMTGRKSIKRMAYERQKQLRREAKVEKLEAMIDEAYKLLNRILSGEQVQMYSIGGRSLQNYQLTPQGIKQMIKEWEEELEELYALEAGMKARKAFVMFTAE